jgi:homoserine O-acetyltransferase
MDLHDVGEGRGSYEAALARIESRVWLVGVTSDILFPDSHVQALANDLVRAGKTVDYWQLDSIHGHDAFLVEFEQMEPLLRRYLERGTLMASGRPTPPTPPAEGDAFAVAGAGLGQHFRFLDGDYE